MLFYLPYFPPETFGSFDIRLLVCFCVMPSQLLVEFSFVVLECPVFFFFCIVLIFVYISLISLLSPQLSGLFPQVVLLFFLVLSSPFSSHIFQDLFFLPFWSVFADFFIWVSSRISHSGFDCFFLLIEGIPIFSHTNFAPA